MNPGEMLAGRYEVVRELGRGGAGITYLARDYSGLPESREVVAKVLHLGLLGDWKTQELFAREAGILKQIHHERIPAYVDFFTLDQETTPRYVLVRVFVPGTTLQAMVEGGWRGTEEQIRSIGARLARIVAYIHSLRPPVIHRDINPRNIIMRDDGEIFLVDFGGVQDALRLSATAAYTVVGTPGYTPLEQFVGRATVRSDLYGLAASLLFLLTHRNPADLPVKDMKIDIPSFLEISSPGFARVLSSWLEPDEGRRTLVVEEAVAYLEGAEPLPEPPRAPPRMPSHPPHGSRIVRTDGDSDVRFLLPSASAPARRGVASFGTMWLVFLGLWTSTTLRSGATIPMLLFSLPILGALVPIAGWTLSTIFGKFGLEIDREGLTYTRQLLFLRRSRTVPLEEVGECTIEEGFRGRPSYGWRGFGMRERTSPGMARRLSLEVGVRTLRFGEGLSLREQIWLRDALNEELQRARAESQATA